MPFRMLPGHVLCLISTLTLAAPAHAGDDAVPSVVDAARILEATGNNAEWLTHGRTYSEQRHSPLTKINRDTVAGLGLAWYFDLDTNRGQEATPLVVDGVAYFTSAWSKVFAVDVRTGRELWRFDPEVPPAHGVNACCDVVNRGVAAWGENVYVGTLDGRLIALQRATGEVVWSAQTADPEKHYTITGAPRAVKGRIIIGNGGAEYGVRGYVSAYDAGSGEMAWRFHTVPGNPAEGFENDAMRMAAKTWNGEWWRYGGGGTVWDSMAYDPKLDLLYIGVGNGSPWNHQIRSAGKGDNLFLSSIVALRPDTGEYVWHFQTTPAESWDYTAAQHMILADLEIDGKTRQVIMQAPKNGFFYVLDRATGEFISGKKYVEINWAQGLDETGRPIENEIARYLTDPAIVVPGPQGGHNWYPMSFHPAEKLVYVPIQNSVSLYAHDENFEMRDQGWNVGITRPDRPPKNPEAFMQARARVPASLLAWDPMAQAEAWRVDYPVPGNSGVLSTGGGLVLQGSPDGVFHAYDAADGRELWSYQVHDAILGGPVTVELDGEQYVLALAGNGGLFGLTGGLLQAGGGAPAQRANGRLLAFKLGARATLPEAEPAAVREPLDLTGVAVEGDAAHGADLYGELCAVCHGENAVSTGSLPDLRFSTALLGPEAFESIVVKGERAGEGMVGFADALEEGGAEDLRSYLISRAREAE